MNRMRNRKNQKEMINLGVFILTSHNINYAHDEADKACIEDAYDKTLSKMASLLMENKLYESLGTKILEPVFSVRKY